MKKDADPELDLYINAVLGRKASDIVVLDVSRLTTVADMFIICSGRSNRQVMAIAEHIQVELKKSGIKPISVEGKNTGHWVLMDYGHIIIHVFYKETRDFFDLEDLWADAERMEIKQTRDNHSDTDDGAHQVLDDDI